MVNKKLRVAVLMGGKSPEHEISVISGTEVVRNLNGKKYDVLPVVISKSGKRWQPVSPKLLYSINEPLQSKGTSKDLVYVNKEISGTKALSEKADVVFIAMHGPFGEDGTVQEMLELAGVPYTGPGIFASALGMDKLRFRKILEAEKIKIPKYLAVKKGKSLIYITKYLGDIPYFVKPHNQGSSVGVSLVKYKKDLKKAISKAHKYSDIALVDEYIEGAEITCGVLGNDKPYALPLVEIVPLKGEFFDYASKYTESDVEEIVPARISKKMTRRIQEIAIEVYKAIDCKGFSRVDFILRNNRNPVVLEINTIPGLTPMSLFPKSAVASGLSYSQLLDKIVAYAIEK